MKSFDSGYTLAEVLIVLVIIAMMIGLATPALMNRLGAAQSRTAAIQLENLATSLDLYRLDMGDYPPDAPGLTALVERPDGATDWSGPYMRRGELPQDPWNRDYLYRRNAEGALEIATLGRDGEPGGEGEGRDLVLELKLRATDGDGRPYAEPVEVSVD